ncbi:MAG: hydroxyacid dehydrogenase [Myxococcales bacterium]|nr:hydroxyacid dehydrogenase [Myxococcales bacterium]
MLILISDAFDASLPGRLAELGEVTDDKDRLADAEVVLVRSKTKCTADYIDHAPELKLIIRGGVGLDNVDIEAAAKKGIAVHNTPEASSIAVAELAMALMLGAACNVGRGHVGMSEGRWLKKELERVELNGKTLGLLGIGRIGREVALRARAFGMRVVAHDPFVSESDAVDALVSLEALLESAHVISLHTPLTDDTRGLLDTERLDRCQRGVIVVNTGRAEVVDEAAMVAALENGQVGCYATDVWISDPPPDDCPLLDSERVLMTPHIGASTTENLLRIGDIIFDKISAYKAGTLDGGAA